MHVGHVINIVFLQESVLEKSGRCVLKSSALTDFNDQYLYFMTTIVAAETVDTLVTYSWNGIFVISLKR
jgi:hypothetical protein